MRANRIHALAAAAIAACSLAFAPGATAALFEDDEARRAILDLRQKMEQQRLANERLFAQQADEIAQMRRSMLELQRQIETLRADLARQTGQNEQLARDISELQRRQRDLVQGIDDRLRKVEPSKVQVDGREFIADPKESTDFEAALATFRKGEFAAAQAAFGDFNKRYPQSGFRPTALFAFTEFLKKYPGSGYKPTALFWLGNAQYANRDYRGAIANFRELLKTAPDHPRAPEALLSIANCQIELKETAGARRTLDELVKTYPQSEAAVAAKERLSKLR